MAVLAGLALIWQYGPRFGIYLVPPSPAAYAEAALRLMDNGYYAAGEPWRRARQKAVEATRQAPNYVATLPALREALAVAGGPHSKLLNSGQSLAERVGKPQPPTVRTVGGISTVKVPAIVADAATSQSYADTLAGALVKASASTSCGWVVDLRGNTGGDMNPMLAGLSPLLGEGKLGGFIDKRGIKTELSLHRGAVQLGNQTTLKTSYDQKLTGPIAVLQDRMTGHPGKWCCSPFRAAAGSALGWPSTGLSSANQVRRLYDGTEMLITVALDMDSMGKVHGGVIEPQQATAPGASPEAARSWLTTQCR